MKQSIFCLRPIKKSRLISSNSKLYEKWLNYTRIGLHEKEEELIIKEINSEVCHYCYCSYSSNFNGENVKDGIMKIFGQK